MVFTKIAPSCQIPHLNSFYEKYFPGVRHGVFVEGGGNDGYTWSNTWGLADIGWHGLYFEPDLELASICRSIHQMHNVRVIGKALGAFDGTINLYQGNGATTRPYIAQFDIYHHGNTPENFIPVPVCTLNTALEQEFITHGFELLVVDVNGDEPRVLAGINLDLWKPTMIIIATHKEHTGWDFNAKIIDDLLSSWYAEVWHDHINSIYIRNTKL